MTAGGDFDPAFRSRVYCPVVLTESFGYHVNLRSLGIRLDRITYSDKQYTVLK